MSIVCSEFQQSANQMKWATFHLHTLIFAAYFHARNKEFSQLFSLK